MWDDCSENAFLQYKKSLQEAVLLTYPSENVPLCLTCDVSNDCVGAVLQIKVHGTWKLLAYFS